MLSYKEISILIIDFISINFLFLFFIYYSGLFQIDIIILFFFLNFLWYILIWYRYPVFGKWCIQKHFTFFLKNFLLFVVCVYLLYTISFLNRVYYEYRSIYIIGYFSLLFFSLFTTRIIVLIFIKENFETKTLIIANELLINDRINQIQFSKLLENRTFSVLKTDCNDLMDGVKKFILQQNIFKSPKNILICDSVPESIITQLDNLSKEYMFRIYFISNISKSRFINNDINIRKDFYLIFNSIDQYPLDDYSNKFKKRIFDIIFSLFVLIFIFSWVFPIVSLLIYLEDKGSIIFSQKRTGYCNKTFKCYKFRSMTINPYSDIRMASEGDERITKIGKFLRKTSIDELPQFINVLLGNMSVVGPRPHMLSDTDRFSGIADKYMLRCFVKPGITGWAQVNGCRGEIKKDEDIIRRVDKDLWYIDNWSMFLDIQIISRTLYISLISGLKSN